MIFAVFIYICRHWHVISCGGMKFEARKMDKAFTVDVEKKGMSLQAMAT